MQLFVEVKPFEFTNEEQRKIKLLSKQSNKGVLKLIGVPERKLYYVLFNDDEIPHILSNYCAYPKNENRFYCLPCSDEIKDTCFNDINIHVKKARSIKF
jgi:hypothetical protein